MMATSVEMRVWIGCLACYNGGDLVGAWYDAVEAADVTIDNVHEHGGYRPMDTGLSTPDAARWSPAAGSPVDLSGHEELWCMDLDGFGGLIDGECSPMEASRVAELVEDLTEEELAALGHFRANYGGDLDAEVIDQFRAAYVGWHESQQDFAQEHAEASGFSTDDLPWPAQYINWEAATRDLFMSGYWSATGNGGVYVFHTI